MMVMLVMIMMDHDDDNGQRFYRLTFACYGMMIRMMIMASDSIA